jgi:predicted flap endonuclease-1-like 5' DNA nuclease
MCIWLPLLLMLGAALLSWFACKSYLQSRVEEEFTTKNQELNDNYQSLNNDFLAYIEKYKQIDSNYSSLQKEYGSLQTDNHNMTLKLSSITAEREKQAAEYQGSLAILESKFKEMESGQVGDNVSFAAPREVVKEVFVDKIVEVPVETIREVEVIKEVFVDKIVEVPVETIREVEVIKEVFVDKIVEVPVETIREVEVIKEVFVDKIVEVPVETIREVEVIKEVFVDKIVEVEIIREIEVTREIDMASLLAMLGQMDTVEVSRTTRAAEKVENTVEITPIIEDSPILGLEIKKDDLTIMEGIGPKIAELLNIGGIFSFEQLANTDIETLQSILDKAGARFQMHKPDTWAEQARYAANGQFDELKVWQDTLNGGRK